MSNRSETPSPTGGDAQQDRIVTAAAIIIGDEILSGRTQDTNLNYIAITLGGWGIRLREARVVADDEDAIVSCVNALRQSHDYVFTTGGIGPTHDDITAACIAKAFGVPLVEHPDIAALIRQREAPPDVMASRLRMALVPEGSGLVENRAGGPPGFYIANVYVMAGIPRVMQTMLASLEGQLQSGAVVSGTSIAAYLAESEIAGALGAIQDAYPDLSLGSYPFMRKDRYGTNLVIRGTRPERIQAALAAVIQAIDAAGAERDEPVDA